MDSSHSAWLEDIISADLLLGVYWLQQKAEGSIPYPEGRWALLYGDFLDIKSELVGDKRALIVTASPLTISDGHSSVRASLTPDCERDLRSRHRDFRLTPAAHGRLLVRKYTLRCTSYGPPGDRLHLVLRTVDLLPGPQFHAVGRPASVVSLTSIQPTLAKLAEIREKGARKYQYEDRESSTMSDPTDFGTQILPVEYWNIPQKISNNTTANAQSGHCRDSPAPAASARNGQPLALDRNPPVKSFNANMRDKKPNHQLQNLLGLLDQGAAEGPPALADGEPTHQLQRTEERPHETTSATAPGIPRPVHEAPAVHDPDVPAMADWMCDWIFDSSTATVASEQQAILMRPDSWQKPQPGHRHIPGNIPIEIFKEITAPVEEGANTNLSAEEMDVDEGIGLPEYTVDSEPLPVSRPDDDGIGFEALTSEVSWSRSPSPEPPRLQHGRDLGLPPDSSFATPKKSTAPLQPSSSLPPRQTARSRPQSERNMQLPSSPPIPVSSNPFEDDMEMEFDIPQALGEDHSDYRPPPPVKNTSRVAVASPSRSRSIMQVKDAPYAKEKDHRSFAEANPSPPRKSQTSSGVSKDSTTSIVYETYEEPTSSGNRTSEEDSANAPITGLEQPVPKAHITPVVEEDGDISMLDDAAVPIQEGCSPTSMRNEEESVPRVELHHESMQDVQSPSSPAFSGTPNDCPETIIKRSPPPANTERAIIPTSEEFLFHDTGAVLYNNANTPPVAERVVQVPSSHPVSSDSPGSLVIQSNDVLPANDMPEGFLAPTTLSTPIPVAPTLAAPTSKRAEKLEKSMQQLKKREQQRTDHRKRKRENTLQPIANVAIAGVEPASTAPFNSVNVPLSNPADNANDLPENFGLGRALASRALASQTQQNFDHNEPFSSGSGAKASSSERDPLEYTVNQSRSSTPEQNIEPLPSTVFEQFKVAYPEYTGDKTHFIGQCKQMLRLEEEDRMVPKFLWDDYLVRNRIDYRDYAVQCLDDGEDAVPYIRYYKDEICARIYRKGILENGSVLQQALAELMPPPPSKELQKSTSEQLRKPASVQSRKSTPIYSRKSTPVHDASSPISDEPVSEHDGPIPVTEAPAPIRGVKRSRRSLPWNGDSNREHTAPPRQSLPNMSQESETTRPRERFLTPSTSRKRAQTSRLHRTVMTPIAQTPTARNLPSGVSTRPGMNNHTPPIGHTSATRSMSTAAPRTSSNNNSTPRYQPPSSAQPSARTSINGNNTPGNRSTSAAPTSRKTSDPFRDFVLAQQR